MVPPSDTIHAVADMARRAGNWWFRHPSHGDRMLSTTQTAWETCIHGGLLREPCHLCERGITGQ